MNFEVESGKSIKLLTKDKVCTEDIVVSGFGGSGEVDYSNEDGLFENITTEYFNDRITRIDNSYAFAHRKNHKFINLPNLIEINKGLRTFFGCSELESVNLPKLTTLGGGGSTFEQCWKLKSIRLPSYSNSASVVSYDFINCYAMTLADFGGLKGISTQAFTSAGIDTLIIRRTDAIATLGHTNALSGTPIANGTGYIYVPRALIENYKVATNWVTFAEQFRAIEDYPEICGGAE